jgi:predicted GIY-YIG superfamily endonuclease
MNYFVYIVRTENNKLYIGHSGNLNGRILDHKNKRGAKFIANNSASFNVVYTEKYATRIEAIRREK